MIIFTDFPLPPSVNKSYPTIGGRRVRSGELKQFLVAAARWKSLHMRLLLDAEDEIRAFMRKGFQVRVDSWFCFEHSRIYTKSGEIKALDAHNFTKPLHDALAELFNIDDRHFWSGLAEKISTPHEAEQCTIIAITPHVPQSKPKILSNLKATVAGA